jgi:hypothetical protein
MMSVRHGVLIGLTALMLVGCASETTKNQASKSSASVAPDTSVLTTQPAAIAQTMSATTPKIVRSGSFVSGEHPTQGTARIIALNGKFFLELDQGFKTSDSGPDLVVILHRSSQVLSSTHPPAYPLRSTDYVVLAPLRQFSGAQRYAIPDKVNLANYQSAAIWCRQFNATFGAAQLMSQ